MIDVTRLSKAYGGRTLFLGASLRIQSGDRIGMVGPNGAGKTTFLKMLVGDESPDSGSVNIQREVRVGYLPQELKREEAGSVLGHTLAGAPEVLALQRELTDIEARWSEGESDLSERHDAIRQQLVGLEAHTLEGRAKQILQGLGFRDNQLDTDVLALSGGWAMRVELARLLLAQPQVLLLDEPTNHLDVQSLAWLEGFLETYPGAWLCISHDRYFLNRLVTSVAELSPDGLFVFEGNYDDYIEARASLEEQFKAEQATRERRANELRSFVERFRAKASKAKQAQSRVKMLEKLENTSTSGALPPPRRRARSLKLSLPAPQRSGDIVATLENVGKRYGERVVYDGLTIALRRGERIAFLGENGAGKSTLLKMLAGAVPPDQGRVVLGHNVETYYFAQHQAEALDPKKTILEEIRALMPLETESRVRGLCGAFLFSGEAADKEVAILSGGEKSRLALAKMLAKPANFLLLDEPTNHLDLQSRDVLESALASYTGTVCFISHDRYFINSIATRILEIRPGGKLADYPGDYEYYLWKSAQMAPPPKAAEVPTAAKPKNARVEEREAKKMAERQVRERGRQAAKLEAEITTHETRLREIDQTLCDPTVYADAARTRELLRERQTLEEALVPLYAAWEAVVAEPPRTD